MPPEQPASVAAPAPGRRFGARLGLLGLVVSGVALAAVVWWALHQAPPRLPATPGELAAFAIAIALYGLNTLIRGERWHHLLLADGARPRRADTHALNVIGYAGNNLLPARAGDAIRVFLAAPRAATSKATVLSTLVAERLLDVAVILVLFVVVGYGVLGEVGAGSLGILALVTAGLAVLAALAVVLARRSRRARRLLTALASATLRLRGAHGARLLAVTFAIWGVEAGVWIAVGHSVGFAMGPMEGLYLVALASVFALIPSGPGYAGTQDAAAAIGIRALGGSGATAVAYLVMLRLAVAVPITLVGVVLLAARYGGLGRLRAAREQATV